MATTHTRVWMEDIMVESAESEQAHNNNIMRRRTGRKRAMGLLGHSNSNNIIIRPGEDRRGVQLRERCGSEQCEARI